MISKLIPIPLSFLLYIPYLNVFYGGTLLRETQPNLPYHSQSLKKDSKNESWVVGRLASLQRGWSVFTGVIEDCCITNMDQVVSSRE